MAENQNFVSKGETGFGDPFAECSDGFNILQFMNDNETTLDNLVQQHTEHNDQNKKPKSYNNMNNQMWINTSNYNNEQLNETILTPNSYNNNTSVNVSNSPMFTDVSTTESYTSDPDQYNYDSYSNNANNGKNQIKGQIQGYIGVKQIMPKMTSPTIYLVPDAKISPQQQQHELNINIPNNNVNYGYYIQKDVKRKRNIDGTPIIVKNEYPKNYQQQQYIQNINNNDNENFQQCLFSFIPYSSNTWTQLYDINSKPLTNIALTILADKGFNYGAFDNSFINQKKNHFQITIKIEYCEDNPPVYFRYNNILKKISDIKVDLCGIKADMPSTEVSVKQSDTDRKTVPFVPCSIKLIPNECTTVTLQRLHFAETTMNNNRKYGKPNPEQKYFNLVIKIIVIAEDGTSSILQSYQSDRFIVRATNPAQFEHVDSDLSWQKSSKNVLYYPGPIAIGADKQVNNAQLTVFGDIVSTGAHSRPSDRRVKTNIVNLDTVEAINRLKNLRLVEYCYKPEFAEEYGINEDARYRVGVIAQELAEIMPDAVHQKGEFLTVDDTRIFYDTVAATQEIHKVTENLQSKIGEVHTFSTKLAKFVKKKKIMGSMSSGLTSIAEKCDDDISTLNYSRTSLNSINNNENNLCSSKLTQRTIVVLIFIMSLCLLAMSSLYILDWYNRTYIYQNYIPVLLPKNISHDYVGNMVEKKYRSWIPEIQPNAPVIAALCGLKDKCINYCCSGKPGDLFDKLNNTTNIPAPLHDNVEIKILNLDSIIDQRYCVNNSCNHKYGYHNLYVPISPFLPTIPLLLQFTVPNEKYVDNCGNLRDFEHKTCQKMEEDGPTSYEIKINIFELNVGEYSQSAFRFRIGYTTESCLMSDDQQGRSFDEYNIIFYRKCNHQNNHNNAL